MPASRKTTLCALSLELVCAWVLLPRASAQGVAEGRGAQRPEPEPAPSVSAVRRLELAEALELARRSNRDLQVAQARLREVQADVERALSGLLPRVSAQGKYTFNYPEVAVTFAASATTTSSVTLVPQNQVDGSLVASVPLLALPTYAALQGARLTYQAQQRQREVTEAQLLRTVVGAFVTAAAAEGILRARSHAIEVTGETLSTARARHQQGVGSRLQVSRAELAALQARQRLREARDARGAAHRALADLLLLRTPFEVAPPPALALDARGEDQLVAEALQRRAEIPALQAQIQAAEVQLRAARWRWAPTVSATGGLRVTNASGFAAQVFYATAGLQLDWQLFDGLERDALAHAAEAQLTAARHKLQQLRERIATSVRDAREQLQSKQEGLEVAVQSQRLAQESLAQVRSQQDAGSANQLDLLTAQDQLVSAEVAIEQARLDLCLQSLHLRYLTGGALLP